MNFRFSFAQSIKPTTIFVFSFSSKVDIIVNSSIVVSIYDEGL